MSKNQSEFKESRSNFIVWMETLSAFFLALIAAWLLVVKSGFFDWSISLFE